jgi:iron complex outermembrane recepter protein
MRSIQSKARRGWVGRSALLSATIIGGLALSVPALAQDANRDDIIVVTGTRIQAPNMVSASPVTTIGQQELDVQQTADIERVFRDLPLTVPGDGQNVNNGSAGASTLNLRNLGTNRTLILINGQRMVPYDINGIIDVSTVPMIMLERVDVVTGGASAVYGSDAMAGAVNFILQEDFTGLEVDYNYQQTESR